MLGSTQGFQAARVTSPLAGPRPQALSAALSYRHWPRQRVTFIGISTLCRYVPRRAPAVASSRSLVALQPSRERIVENESHVNKKLLVSAAAVCFLTHVLTVQGMLLAAYLAAATAVPVGAVNHAIKQRNAWPALSILLPLLLVPNIGFLKAIYMSVVSPVSVQIKARITLPALIHTFVGSKHPALRAGLQSAKIASQVILLVLLLQYLLAPKVAESMRQKAIMLCRAFTTTESQGMHTRAGEASLGTWPNREAGGAAPPAEPDSFRSSISRGSAQKWDTFLGGDAHNFERLEKLRETVYKNLPEGEQPSITEVYALAGAMGSQYSYVSEKRMKESPQHSEKQTGISNRSTGSTPTNSRKGQPATAIHDELSSLGLAFESDQSTKATEGISTELDSVVDAISSPEELFEVLNEQLNMVQSLADEVRSRGVALQRSEEAREDLVRELEATVGEKQQLGHELTTLALRFEAAQSVWERHLDQGGSLADFLTGENLDSLVDALTERGRVLAVGTEAADSSCSVVDGDALAAKFRIHPDEVHLSSQEVLLLLREYVGYYRFNLQGNVLNSPAIRPALLQLLGRESLGALRSLNAGTNTPRRDSSGMVAASKPGAQTNYIFNHAS